MSGTTTKDQEKAGVSSAIKVKPGLPKVEPGAKTERYWIGTVPTSPIQNVTVGGVCFPRFRGNPVFDRPGDAPDRALEYGVFADLTDDQVDAIKKGVAARVVRPIGLPDSEFDDAEGVARNTRKTGQMLMVDGPKYRRQPRDIPLARLLYMHRAADLSVNDYNVIPETMEA